MKNLLMLRSQRKLGVIALYLCRYCSTAAKNKKGDNIDAFKM